jgi:hypothetical protein
MRGLSDDHGSWKTACTMVRYRLSGAPDSVWMSWPSTSTWPAVGSSSLRMSLAVVVFPQPDSPTIASVSPWGTEKLMPSTALTWPRTLVQISPCVTGKCFVSP